MRKWNQTKTIKNRILFGFILVVLISIAIIFRLKYWQVDQRDFLLTKANPQWSISIPIQPRRGTILDAKGRTLALNVNADTIAAIPAQIKNYVITAKAVSEALNIDYESVLDKFNSGAKQIFLKRMVSDELSERIQKLNLSGIITIQESKRFYPNGSLAAQVLGFSGIDKGWAGIEYIYDEELQGSKGVINFGNKDEKESVSYIKPEEGNQVSLTIDLNVQSVIEAHLKDAKDKYRAESSMAIVVDIKSGALISVASVPSFDPNNYQDYSKDLWKNPLIEDVFEPGSTFKIITMAAALEEGIISSNDKYMCKGSLAVADRIINCWDRQGHGLQNYYEIMQNSCNIGFMEIAQELGAEKLYKYIDAFGFTHKTGVDLPSEAKGIMFKKEAIGPVELATTSFGQGPAVTPIQQIMALAAIANDGIMLDPYIVDNIKDKNNELVYKHQQTSERVISQETSNELRKILESVVTDGTGHRAYVEGYRTGGKTGTAQIALAEGGYSRNKFISSFIGLAPANDPAIALFVAIKNPTRSALNSISGGVIAAPLFGDIMKDILRYLKVPKQISSLPLSQNSDTYKMTDLIGKSGEIAAAQIWAINGVLDRDGPATGTVVEQKPQVGEIINPGDKIYIKTQKKDFEDNYDVLVPDVKGLSMREGAYSLGELGLRVETQGSGIIVSQTPEAGQTVRVHTLITINLEPRSSNGREENENN